VREKKTVLLLKSTAEVKEQGGYLMKHILESTYCKLYTCKA
jgi:hypothetical protein